MIELTVTRIVALAICVVTGCATTRYMAAPGAEARVAPVHSARSKHHMPEPVAPLSPPASDLPEDVPRVTGVTAKGWDLVYPSGTRVLLPAGEQLLLVRTDHKLGALEGMIGGLLCGLALGGIVAAKSGCDDCVLPALAVSALLSVAVGTMYGATRGHTTTYVYGAADPWARGPPPHLKGDAKNR